MRDLVTVIRKETLDLLGDWRSPRGSILQAAFLVALAGFIIPYLAGAKAYSYTNVIALYMIFPSIAAASAASDAFAGERERRTLETLLASPLSDFAILVGKAGTAVLYGVTISGASLALAGIVTGLGGSGTAGAYLATKLVVGAFGSSLLAAALAVWISMKTLVAKSAQGMTTMAVFAFTWTWGLVTQALGLTIESVWWIDAAFIALGVAALWAALAGFRRERVFDRR